MGLLGRKEDGRAEIIISDDGLSARCILYPSIGDGNRLTEKYLRLLAEQAGITSHIDWALVNAHIDKAQGDGRRFEFTLTTGTPPVQAIPGHLKLKKRFFLAATHTAVPLAEEGGRVDYRERTPFTVVAKGEPIARLVDEFPGVPGSTVTGQSIKPPLLEVLQFIPGENLTLGDDKRYRSTVDGLFYCKDKTFSVSHSLVVQGDVDLHTGHIKFPGDMKVTGGIKRGFRVLVTGSLACAQTIEATSVTVGVNLETAEGIIGCGGEGVKVGGQLSAKFLEGAHVECRGLVRVKDSVFNSQVYTMDRLVLGAEGKLLGGQVHAVNGVQTHVLGNDMGLYGEVHTGQDFVKSRALHKLKQMILKLGLKRDTLMDLRSMGRRVDDKIKQVDDAIEELNVRITEGHQAIDKNRDARIEVTGTVFPGVLVSICSASFYVREKMANTVFCLEEDHVVAKPL
ncbi:MAG: DUF342 domain-containing protein [Spirochaetales bacterium]|nr:DUF342 domain-containing protein [Spirochaetales bacterium]